MNKIVRYINDHREELNKNQATFWNFSGDVFDKIEDRVLSHSSSAKLQDDKLYIFLQHNSDEDTTIEIEIDKNEVVVTVAGMGRSMIAIADDRDEKTYFSTIKKYLLAALSGSYKKKVYYRKDEPIKSQLIWKTSSFPTMTYSSFLLSLKEKFFGVKPENYREFEYSSFLQEDVEYFRI